LHSGIAIPLMTYSMVQYRLKLEVRVAKGENLSYHTVQQTIGRFITALRLHKAGNGRCQRLFFAIPVAHVLWGSTHS